MTKLLLIILPGLLVPLSDPEGSGKRAESQNTTGLRLEVIKALPRSYGVHFPRGARRCVGIVSALTKTPALADLSHWLAKEGVDCIPADFDGNGFLDVALLAKGWEQDTDAIGVTEVTVLLFDRNGLTKTVKLPRQVSVFSFELYPATEKQGPFGEPTTATEGLIDGGEGGTTYVFRYQRDGFVVSEHASENH